MKVLSHLSLLLKGEIQSANTYLLHYKKLQDLGWYNLANREKENQLDEMNHAEKFIERILLLGGEPVIECPKINPGKDVESILEVNIKLEEETITNLRTAITDCLLEHNYGTFNLLQDMLVDEEKHVSYLKAQYKCLQELGLNGYVQKYG